MLTPLAEITAFLSCAFLLGLALGWILWKFSDATQSAAKATEVNFWQKRFDQARLERDLDQDKIAALEAERDLLRNQLAG